MEGMFLVILHVLIGFRIYTPNYGTFCNTKSHKSQAFWLKGSIPIMLKEYLPEAGNAL